MKSATEYNEIYMNYHHASYEIGKLKKAYMLKESFKHISGVTINALAVIPVFHVLGEGSRRKHAIISTLGKDLENNWLKISPQSDFRYVSIKLEEFLALPNWNDSMLFLKCHVEEESLVRL